MKMFLTRLGEGAHMAVTGDPSQTDLPAGQPSGLADALAILNGVTGVSIVHFEASDVVRHPLVARIIEAYDQRVKRPTQKS
jgi:phosphate starvation-inducible PhoH-like protein